ncbi:MAG: hypothetical protein ACLFNU_08255 [Bacteroidales bacterium]
MEPFTINLNQMQETSGRYKRFLLILTSIFLIASAISLVFFHKAHNEWIVGLFALYLFIFAYFAYAGHKAKLYVTADEFAIEYQFGFFVKTPSSIMWQAVKKVRLGPTYITFIKRSGRGKRMLLGWLPYAKVIEIKEKIKDYCVAKGIEVEVADFKKG